MNGNYLRRHDGESDEHWKHRMRVANFYKFNTEDVRATAFWPMHWGTRPPANEAYYQEPPDLGPRTNGASGRAPG